MKPNDKAIEAGYNACTTVSRSIVIDIITAAFAAQFQSEEYADVIKSLRVMHDSIITDAKEQFRDGIHETMPSKAADALEAVLAERDELDKWLRESKQNFMRVDIERNNLRAERDALLARLAPVDDEELVEIVAKHFIKENKKSPYTCWKKAARDAIAAIRPHIEAAERERCAKVAETPELWLTDKPSRGCDDIAAAIRSWK